MREIAKIIILGEDQELLVLKKLYLLREGFEVTELNSINNIERHLQDVHLLILNQKMATIDGLEMMQYIRHKGYTLPTIFLGEERSEGYIEKAFDAGIDDYMVKPFSIRELVCRIKALVRRSYGIKQERLTHRDIVLDFNTRMCRIEENEIDLTKLEFDLLSFFIQNKNTILERDYILEQVWDDPDTKKRTINVRMNRLMKKIDPDNTKNYFTAIRGIGYRFN